MRKIILFFAFVVLIFAGCNEPEDIVKPTGKLIYQSDCLGSKSFYTENNESCIEYSYDPTTKALTLYHKNAGFNCCPGAIDCDFASWSGIITITEKEETAGCHCSCLYNLTIELYQIKPETYTIRIVEPYIGDQQNIEFEITLAESQHGEFCIERNIYPWVSY